MASLNYGQIGEQAVRMAMSGGFTAPQTFNKMTTYLNAPKPDYYNAGKEFGVLWQQLFDITLNAWSHMKGF